MKCCYVIIYKLINDRYVWLSIINPNSIKPPTPPVKA